MDERRLRTLLVTALAWAACHAADAGGPAAPPGARTPNTPRVPMIRVPEGRFVMGSRLGRDHWDESPTLLVSITRPFEIGERDVTVGEFRAFRPGFAPDASPGEPARGVSWYDAVAFCAWLSAREGAAYRLPTEAEWEYASRAGGDGLFPGGDAPPDPPEPNAWGVVGMAAAPAEWCRDWYGPYDPSVTVDPVGPARGLARVVRGGAIDDPGRRANRTLFDHCASRAAVAPSFGPMLGAPGAGGDAEHRRAGLIGAWYAESGFERPQTIDLFDHMEKNWINDVARGRDWSGRWRGTLRGPWSGRVVVRLEAAPRGTLRLGGLRLESADGKPTEGVLEMTEDRGVPIGLSFVRDRGGPTLLRVSWSYDDRKMQVIDAGFLRHEPGDREAFLREGARMPAQPGLHGVGFRIVRASTPSTRPTSPDPPLVVRGVQPPGAFVAVGPDPAEPYFRKRRLLPVPPDNAPGDAIDALALHPGFRNHNHCPALEVCPNGDVLCVLFTSYAEYEPGVTFMATRLRFGTDAWDMPSPFVGFAQANDHPPLLWTEWSTGRLWFFWGSPRLEGGYPCQWTTSDDSGATFAAVRFPRFVGRIGAHTRQPINSAFRNRAGTLFVSSDGDGSRSVLWASDDAGETWRDTGGRTTGRHTTYALLEDGRTILGFGGKNCEIDGFMPVATSVDDGASWSSAKTPFPEVGGNQRPSVLRLASGRLWFASDFQHIQKPQPEGVEARGSFVALSADEGRTWHVRRLPGTQPHERPEYHGGSDTIGYTAMRQAPNGLIHLVTTMNEPCLHFEFNEAWILSDPTADAARGGDAAMASTATAVAEPRAVEAALAGGGRISYAVGRADDGRILRHGREEQHDASGRLRYACRWSIGRKVGIERARWSDGSVEWEWRHRADGTSTWTQYWPNGVRKAESTFGYATSWVVGRRVDGVEALTVGASPHGSGVSHDGARPS